jgi:WXG100 family type VII secretion target
MADMKLKVAPETLTALAAEAKRIAKNIENVNDEIKSAWSDLNDHWDGESSDLFSKHWVHLDNYGREMAKKIFFQAEALEDLAKIYNTAEQSAKKSNEGLPTDGVFR